MTSFNWNAESENEKPPPNKGATAAAMLLLILVFGVPLLIGYAAAIWLLLQLVF